MYENLYRENVANGNIIIEIVLDDYMHFFHQWDNAIFRKRDMHPELAAFLDICSADIPLSKKLDIQFYVKNKSRDENREKMIFESYHNYYEFFGRMEKKKTKRNFRYAFVLLLVALVLIFLHTILVESVLDRVWSEVFLEGLLIGGWVFMWESLHMVSFESQDLFRRNKELVRFLKATITFKY